MLTAMRSQVEAGRNVTLSPETANIIIMALEPRPYEPNRWHIDLYASGSCIYQLDRRGEVLEIVAWARSTGVARAALEKLKEQYPEDRFSQRRRSWVEG